MRCDDGCQANLGDKATELRKNLIGGLGVKISGRFIGQENGGLVGQGSGNCNPLLLTTG